MPGRHPTQQGVASARAHGREVAGSETPGTMADAVDARVLAQQRSGLNRPLISSAVMPARSSSTRVTTPWLLPAIRASSCSTVRSGESTTPHRAKLAPVRPPEPGPRRPLARRATIAAVNGR